MPNEGKKAEMKVMLRPPVVAVMGHIDHGKSTLLDYIRKTNIVESEAGGITQRAAAYEVVHTTKDGAKREITFIDTPGHEAFRAIRARGARAADVAVLVVSAEDGVKPQTLEALRYIKESKTPFVVALTKIDKPAANLERAKQTLLENEIYIEGYGGDIPAVALSSKTGAGVDELLEVILLLAELSHLSYDPAKSAEGFVLETSRHKTKGIAATLIVKDGALARGSVIGAGRAIAPVRILEDFRGKAIESARAGAPAIVIGWSELPEAGAAWRTFPTKREAEESAETMKENVRRETPRPESESPEHAVVIPLLVKADTTGSLEAVLHEIKKLDLPDVKTKIIASGIGPINESDAKRAAGGKAVILGFTAAPDAAAKNIIERDALRSETFDVIYSLIEWLQKAIAEKRPKILVEKEKGKARAVKLFGGENGKQIVGGRVAEGSIELGDDVKIMRRGFEIGRGTIRELQKMKEKVREAQKDTEFGALISAGAEVAVGDELIAFTTAEETRGA